MLYFLGLTEGGLLDISPLRCLWGKKEHLIIGFISGQFSNRNHPENCYENSHLQTVYSYNSQVAADQLGMNMGQSLIIQGGRENRGEKFKSFFSKKILKWKFFYSKRQPLKKIIFNFFFSIFLPPQDQ